MTKPRLATIWLDGCSGCHMSLLDLDERLLDIFARADIVFGPLVDVKEFPADVDVTLVEGAVSTSDDLRRIHEARKNTRILVSLGDCAVTSNVPGMRNPFGPKALLECGYIENATLNAQIPATGLPTLLPECRPVHSVVKVDVFLPGCPPSADQIYDVLDKLLSGQAPETPGTMSFG